MGVDLKEGISPVSKVAVTEPTEGQEINLRDPLPQTIDGLDSLLRNYLFHKGYITESDLKGIRGNFSVKGLNVISGIEKFMTEIGTDSIKLSGTIWGYQARFDGKIYTVRLEDVKDFTGNLWTQVSNYYS